MPSYPQRNQLALSLLLLFLLGASPACVLAPATGESVSAVDFGASEDGKADGSDVSITGWVLCRDPWGLGDIRCPSVGTIQLTARRGGVYAQAVPLTDFDLTYGSCSVIDDLRDDNRDGRLRSDNYYCYAICTPKFVPTPAPEPVADPETISPTTLGDVPLYVLGEWHNPDGTMNYPYLDVAPEGDHFVSKLRAGGGRGAVLRGDPSDMDPVGGFDPGVTWGLDESTHLVIDYLQDDGSIARGVFYRLQAYEPL